MLFRSIITGLRIFTHGTIGGLTVDIRLHRKHNIKQSMNNNTFLTSISRLFNGKVKIMILCGAILTGEPQAKFK